MASSLRTPRSAFSPVATGGSRLEADDYEVNLEALQSQDIALSDVGTSFSEEQKLFILRRMHTDGLVNFSHLPPAVTFMIEKIASLSEEESVQILKEYLRDFDNDVNIDHSDYNLNERLVAMAPSNLGVSAIKEKVSSSIDGKQEAVDVAAEVHSESTDGQETRADIKHEYHRILDWSLQVKVEAGLIAYHSPYPTVRSVTEPYDDPAVPCETIRVYIIGTIWTAIGTVINQFFSQRQPSISFGSLVAQVFIYASGLLFAYIVPKWKFRIWRWEFDCNPGPWSYKEQMLATLFFSVSGGSPYVSLNITVQKMKMFYGNTWVDFGYQVLLMLSTQYMGFGFGGIIRRFVIYPVQSIWPTLLPYIALNKALTIKEERETIHGWKILRYNFFFSTFAASFLYFWFPNYIMQCLSTFNWIAWIKPENYNLAVITGSVTGLGFNPISTFDWNVLSSNNPLATPFYSTVLQAIGWFISFFCIVAVFYSNNKWTSFMPVNSNSLFTNTGEIYRAGLVLNEKGLFDSAKYQEVGPPFYSAAALISYGSSFALYPFAFLYEITTNWRTNLFALQGMYHSFRNFRKSNYDGFTDPFSRLMARYNEVPDWFFILILVVSIVLAIVCVKHYPADTPVWGIFFALGINLVFLIPLCSIYSRTGFSIGLNVLIELIVGYALPGNALALMFIKALGTNIDGQAENYITNQKQAHYVRIPPWSLMRTQLLSVFINVFVALGILNFQLTGISDYCDPLNKQRFSCPTARTFYSSSVIWGVIGPKRVFDGLYPILKYCFLIGFLVAFPCILFKWYAPKRWTKYFQPTVVMGGFTIWAPYNLSYYIGGLYLAIYFMWYLYTR